MAASTRHIEVLLQAESVLASPVRVYLSDVEDRSAHNQRQRRALSRLGPPRVVNAPAAAFTALPLRVYLTDVEDRRVHNLRQRHPKSALSPPVVVFEAVELSGPQTALSYSLRGTTKPRLVPPAVVTPASTFVARPLIVHLSLSARQGREATYDLAGPFVISAPPKAKGRTATQFVQPPRIPTHSRLRPPTVVTAAAEALVYGPLVTLAPFRTGKAKSRLLPVPVAFQPFRPAIIHLTFAPTRARAKSRLAAPVVVTKVLARPVDTTLVRIRPVRTLKELRGPVVIDLSPQTFFVDVTLAPSRFPTPKSILREPPKGTPQPAPVYPLFTTLAPQKRGKAKSFLRKTVYAARVYAPITVTLAPPRFPRPKSILRKPVVVGTISVRPTLVTLAPQRRGQAKPFLREVVYGAKVFAPISVTLTRLAPPKRFYRLSPPSVVEAVVVVAPFRGLDVTLAYSRRGTTMWRLTLTRAQIIECYGDVVGTDFAATVCGVTSADATVSGTTSSRGTISGGDTKREGC